MNRGRERALAALRWALGGVLLLQAALLAFHPDAPAHFSRSGYPDWARLLLAWSEILAAALFLLPGTVRLGGWALAVVLLGAGALHLARGEMPPAPFLIYLLAINVVLAHHPRQKSAGVQP